MSIDLTKLYGSRTLLNRLSSLQNYNRRSARILQYRGVEMSKIEDVIKDRIRAVYADAEVQLTDLTGTLDHWEALIISSDFEGMRLIQRQQGIYRALGDLMTGPVHAFTMRTLTPSEAEAKGINLGTDKEQKQPNQPNQGGLFTLK